MCEIFFINNCTTESDDYYMCIVSLYLLDSVASVDITCGDLKRHTGWMYINVGICDFHYIPHIAIIVIKMHGSICCMCIFDLLNYPSAV